MISPQRWNKAIRYAVAPVTVALALVCRLALNPILHESSPFMYFFAAIIVSAWLGGWGPGLTTTVLSLFVADYFYLKPLYTILGGGLEENIQLGSFLILGAMVSMIVARMRREQRRAERSDHRERQRSLELETVLQSVPICVWIAHDLDCHHITGNRTAEEFLRLPPGGEASLTAPEGVRPTHFKMRREGRDLASDELPVQVAARGATVRNFEYSVVFNDGTVCHMLGNATPLLDERGIPHGSIAAFMDITERKKAETQLRLQATALDAAANGIIVTDPEGTILWANPAFTAMTGYGIEEVIGLNPHILKSNKQDETFYLTMWETIRRGETWHGELINRRKDGSLYTEEMAIAPVKDECGGISHYIAIKQDITARKGIEERLKDSERRLTDIIEFLPDATFALDNAGRIIAWNKAMEDLTGAPAVEVLGKGNHEHTYRLYGQRIPCLADTVLRGDQAKWAFSNVILENGIVKAETYIPHLKPGGVWLSIKVAPIYDAQGNVAGVIDSCRDITERKQGEEALNKVNERLLEADRRKDEFLAMLAHELRNPLAPIRYAVQMLSMDGLAHEQMRKQHEVIDRQVGHMGRLLDDLLEVSRFTRGKIQLKREIVDLRTVATQALDSMRPMIEGRGQFLAYEGPSSPLLVDGDPTRLEQIIRNLLHNANKYTEAGGCIKVSLLLEPDSEHDWRAAVHVIDSGIGIEPEILPRVFEAFVQAEQGLARSQGGLGIGLAMVKSLVQMHGGIVEAHSAGPGHGSEFVVHLPLVPAATGGFEEVSVQEEQYRVALSKPRRVLVVDDNEDAAASLSELLSLWGHEVHTAHDGKHALATARRWQPEIILLDIGLPGMDGYEVARRLREEPATSSAYLVALTGYGQEEDRRRALEAGFNQHLTKPVELGQLQDLLLQAKVV